MSYESAKAAFADWGVDTEAALTRLADIPISMHCWQGDDVVGFEQKSGSSGGGIQATGNHPGRARTPDELRADLEFSYRQIPGNHRLNLHAFYLDTNQKPDRDEIEFSHFAPWVDWAKDQGLGLDFNPTFFAHEKADDNLTLSHPDQGIRDFWIEHGKRSRDIAAQMGAALGTTCVNNIWVPDGYKDTPVDRMAPRRRLEASLDAMMATPHDKAKMLDAVESKLFGIGVEACTVGSHEFYMGYAIPQRHLVVPRHGPFPSNRKRGRQTQFGCLISWRNPAPRQPSHALGQRPRNPSRRCNPANSARIGERRFIRTHPYRPRFL